MRWLFLVCVLAGCSGDDGPELAPYFELDGSIDDPAAFWDMPFPSDLRLADTGAPDLTGFPNPRKVPILNALLSVANDRRGWPVMPIVYVRFRAPVPEQTIDTVIPPGDERVVLVDIDPTSPERGTSYPLVAASLPADPYVPSDLIAFAPRPGIVLRGDTRYALIVRSAFAPGFQPAPQYVRVMQGKAPGSARGTAAIALYADLGAELDTLAIPRDDVLVATIFTTGDEVVRSRKRSDAVLAAHHPTIDNLALFGGTTHDGFCELRGTVTMPQFQKGAQPYDIDGRFVLDANDLPQKQSEMTIPLRITLPKAAMPATGWPLYQFFHGSGGLSSGIVDLGYSPTPDDMPEPGKGPGWVVARQGIAAASAAMPVNPERLPGATDYAYLNINNLSAFPYTFQCITSTARS
jgi:hypothetical protein